MSIVGSGLLARDMAASLGHPSLSAWFGSIVNIMTLATILPVSQSSDYWGRKPFILTSNAFGFVGFLIVARSNNIATGLAGFVLGSDCFGCQALCYAIPSEVLNRKYRGFGQASVNISGGLAALTGSLIGGALTKSDTEGWRTYWYICAAMFALGAVGVFFGYNPPPREKQTLFSTTQKLGKMDWTGILLIATGTVLFAMSLQWSGNPYTWSDGHVLGPFVSGIFLLLIFVGWEWKGTKEGILHHSLFKHRNFPLATTLTFLEGLSFFTLNTFFVPELITVGHFASTTASYPFVVNFAAAIAIAPCVGAYITWAKQVREPLALGFFLLTTFCVLMSFFHNGLSIASAYGYAIVGGAGFGCILTSALTAAQMATPRDQISLSSGLPTAARSLGAAVGIAINNAIFNNSFGEKLPQMVAAAVVPLGFDSKDLGALISALTSQSQAAMAKVPGITPQITAAAVQALTEAYRVSYRGLWIAAGCFAGVAVIGKFEPVR